MISLGTGPRFWVCSGLFDEVVQQTGNELCFRESAAVRVVPVHVADARILHGKEGVDGSSPSEGFKRGQQMAFLLPKRRTPITRSSLNLSPRSVPNISGALAFWLK
jgi:hypothetical protein